MAERFTNAQIQVFWDCSSYEIPQGVDPYIASMKICSALKANNHLGFVSFWAYGDEDIHEDIQRAQGILLRLIPRGDTVMLSNITVDMLLWAKDNPAPANIMLI